MKKPSFLFAVFISSISIIPHVQATDTSSYKSLEEFCNAEKKDTPENCECGQATADKLLSSKEQAMALALMQGDRTVVSELGEKQAEFMNKLSHVTKGCPKPATP